MGKRSINVKVFVSTFALVHAKILVYFSIKTYFFIIYLFLYSLFKTLPHRIIYFALNFIKIPIFLEFFNCLTFWTHNNRHLLFSFIPEIHKEK